MTVYLLLDLETDDEYGYKTLSRPMRFVTDLENARAECDDWAEKRKTKMLEAGYSDSYIKATLWENPYRFSTVLKIEGSTVSLVETNISALKRTPGSYGFETFLDDFIDMNFPS